MDFLAAVARFLLWAGGIVALLSVALLLFYIFLFASNTPPAANNALSMLQVLQKSLLIGVLSFGVGAAFTFWGSEFLGISMLAGAALLYGAPFIFPFISAQTGHVVVQSSLAILSQSGAVLGLVGVLTIIADLVVRFRNRAAQGIKADQLKYGKGVKEEVEKQNVFMGKCWQLPFCRKFVRERCPIYHARRTCWRELVGCMCEEEVIRGAMENRAIPKDMVAATKYIPQNNKLTFTQKRERCKQCVIYNEHQKHKYKFTMPFMVVGFVAVFFLLHPWLMAWTHYLVDRVNVILQAATYDKVGSVVPPDIFQELLLICFGIIFFAYAMKLVEYLIFKLKI